MNLTEHQIRKLRTAYNKGDRLALIKMVNNSIRATAKVSELEKLTKIQDEHPNVYSIEDIHFLIN